MSITMRLQDCVHQACSLLGCTEGYVLLGCTDPSARHPLLNTLPAHLTHPIPLGDQLRYAHVLSSEPVAALCDIALYTGTIWCIDRITLPETGQTGSLAVAPLIHSQGMLGLLLFIDTQEMAFLQGEWLLLKQFLSTCGQRIAEILQEQHYYHDSRKQIDVVGHRSHDELISLVSHELRGPLTAIKGYVELLRAYGLCDEQNTPTVDHVQTMTRTRQRHYLESISEQARQLEVLTGDLLDVSRLQAGQLALHCMWIDLAHICQSVARLMQESVEQQHPTCYTMRCHVYTAATLAWADPNRVQQILTNLLENAIKYSPDGGLIEVLVTSVHTYGNSNERPIMTRNGLSVTVRDQGVGIPRQQQGALFKPFSRIEQAATHNINGCGLGLYIARSLVEAMGGQISLQSSEGVGTSITFTLPTAP